MSQAWEPADPSYLLHSVPLGSAPWYAVCFYLYMVLRWMVARFVFMSRHFFGESCSAHSRVGVLGSANWMYGVFSWERKGKVHRCGRVDRLH